MCPNGAARSIRLTERLSGAFRDLQLADGIRHTVIDLLRQRIFGIALGYEDLIDHDQLKFVPALTAVLDRPGGQLVCKSTLNRLEHAGKIGQDRHHKLVGIIAPELKKAERRAKRTGQPASRCTTSFRPLQDDRRSEQIRSHRI